MFSLSSNIWKLQVMTILRWFMLFMPIIVLFYQSRGLSQTEVVLLQVVFSAAIVLLEIPSGYISDRFGRKNTLLFGSVLSTLGYGIYLYSFSFSGFLLAEMLLGIGVAFVSGADSALLFDSLKELGRSDEYKKIQGKMDSYGNFSEGTAGILGGLLAGVSLNLPLWGQFFLVFLSVPFAFFLLEPAKHTHSEASLLKDLGKIIKYALHEHTEVKWLIFYSGLISASTFTMVWFIQPYLQQVGLPIVFFGVVWAALQFFTGGVSYFAENIENFLGKRTSFILLVFLVAIGYFAVSFIHALWGAVFLLLFYFVRGLSSPVMKDYINKLIESRMRATVLSLQSFMMRAIFVIVGPVIGFLSDSFSLSFALVSAGGLFLVLGLISILMMWKNEIL